MSGRIRCRASPHMFYAAPAALSSGKKGLADAGATTEQAQPSFVPGDGGEAIQHEPYANISRIGLDRKKGGPTFLSTLARACHSINDGTKPPRTSLAMPFARHCLRIAAGSGSGCDGAGNPSPGVGPVASIGTSRPNSGASLYLRHRNRVDDVRVLASGTETCSLNESTKIREIVSVWLKVKGIVGHQQRSDDSVLCFGRYPVLPRPASLMLPV